MDKHISFLITTRFPQFLEFAIFEVSSLNLLLAHMSVPLYILAVIIVIVFFMIWQSILFIVYKKIQFLSFLLLLIPLALLMLFQFSSLLFVKYRINFKLSYIGQQTLLLGNLIIKILYLFPN